MATQTLQQPKWLELVWHSRWTGIAVAVSFAALIGLVSALVMPRGPITTAQALTVMASCFVIGVMAAMVMRSGWAMLLAPVVYMLVFELGRWGAVGPTVDAPRLDNAFGILALILGRGFHLVLALLPMVVGSSLGLVFARNLAGASVRWTPSILGVLVLVALVVWVALPARTPPILGDDGKPVPGSIAELTTVRLGGQNQVIMIRAYSPDKPVLLYLSGGPGQSDLPYSRVMFENLSQDFVVVGWDQRGTGKSYSALEPISSLTLEQAISDTLELSNYLRNRFGEEKIYLMGESWGTTLGVLAAQRQPNLFHAFIGSGQMVSQRETDKRLYQDILNLADRTGNSQLASRMRSYGEPPYADIPYANATVMGYYEQLYKPYRPPQAYVERGTRANLGPWGIFGSEYKLVEKVNVLRGLVDMFAVMYPQLQQIDFRKDVQRLELPLYILDGAAELTSRRDLVLEWYKQVEAPAKQIFTFENAGHSVAFEQFEALHKIMLNTILPQTYPAP